MSCERLTILNSRVSSFLVSGFLFVIFTLLVNAADAADKKVIDSEDHSSAEQLVICKVVMNRRNIFTSQNARADSQPVVQSVFSSVNRLHKTTRESVILREAGVAAGDTLSVQSIADIERRLRKLGLFASVAAKLITQDDCVELHIDTQDNFSIVFGASGSYLGGVGNIGFKTGEKNLLGTGNQLLLGLSRNSQGAFRGSIVFDDLHFFDKDWRAKYRIGRTNEGDFYGVSLSDSFRSSRDKREWSFVTERVESDKKYYSSGTTVVAIPQDQFSIGGQHVWRSSLSGKQDSDVSVANFRRGVVLRLTQSDYSALRTTESNTLFIEQPNNQNKIYLGGLLGLDTVDGYIKTQGLDTLNFVQDISIGSSAEIQFGVSVVDEEDAAGLSVSRTDPELAVILRKSALLGKQTLLNLSLASSATFEEQGARPWASTAAFKAFYIKSPKNTLAFNMDFSTGEDGSGLPVQYTLGEESGLRGYEVRQFDGRQRLRVNVETRYRPGWKLGVLDIGAVGFFDAGWASAKGASSPSFKRSFGAGLRLASNAILGSQVIRVDVAAPLDAPVGESSNPRLSVAVGQVFRF